MEKIEKYDRIEGTEGYPSGRRGLIANELVWGNLERGFKSLTLRHWFKLSLRRKFSKEDNFRNVLEIIPKAFFDIWKLNILEYVV